MATPKICGKTTAALVALLLYGTYITVVHFKLAAAWSSIVCSSGASRSTINAPEKPSLLSGAAVLPDILSQPKQTNSKGRYTRPSLFNPWRDFVFTDINNDDFSSTGNVTTISPEGESPRYYSSHSCVAADHSTRRRDSVSRTCHFRNLYYYIPNKTWHYYPNPTEQAVLANGDAKEDEMDTAIWHVREGDVNITVIKNSRPWRPEVHLDSGDPTSGGLRPTALPLAKVVATNNGLKPVFVLYRGTMPNYGHFIWDDFLSIYSQLDLMDLADDDSILPIPFVDDPKTYFGGSYCLHNSLVYEKCVKFWKKLYPDLWNIDTDCSGDIVRTGNWLQGNRAIGKWDRHGRQACGDYRDELTNSVDTEYVVIPHVTVGSGRLALFSCYGECTLGRGPQLYRFRNYLMRRMLGEAPKATPINGYITFSLAYGASRGKGEVSFFEEEIEAARQRYGEEAVRAVDFANMTLKEQGILIGNSAALFTNHGGGSASTVFLPKGSSAFVYWRGQMRDHEFYRSVAYFTTQWIGYDARENVERTMRLLDMEIQKTGVLYPDMISLQKQVAK